MPKPAAIYTENLFVRVTPASSRFIRSHTDHLGVSLSFFFDEFIKKVKDNPEFFKVSAPMTVTERKALEAARKKQKYEWTRARNREKKAEAEKAKDE